MPFCAQCGAEGQGNFCPSCGAPRGTATAAGPAASSSPIDDNLAAALCYLLGLLTGIVFLVIEPYNRNREIRFHAFQSIFLSAGFFVASIAVMILSSIPFLGWVIALLFLPALYVAGFVLWIMLMIKAYNRERWVLPVIGPMAEKQA
jgi:uncharacterized membrane protein